MTSNKYDSNYCLLNIQLPFTTTMLCQVYWINFYRKWFVVSIKNVQFDVSMFSDQFVWLRLLTSKYCILIKVTNTLIVKEGKLLAGGDWRINVKWNLKPKRDLNDFEQIDLMIAFDIMSDVVDKTKFENCIPTRTLSVKYHSH